MTLDALLLITLSMPAIVVLFRQGGSRPGWPFRGYLPPAPAPRHGIRGFWLPYAGDAGVSCGLLTGGKRERDERAVAAAGPVRGLRIDPAQAEAPPKVLFVPLVGAIGPDA